MITGKDQRGIQHYVPQCYLKAFGYNKNQVMVMSKQGLVVNSAKIRDICAEDDFFTLDGTQGIKDEFGNEINQYRIDDIVQQAETGLGEILKPIRKNKNFDGLNGWDIADLLKFVTWLFIANPGVRGYLSPKYPGCTNSSVQGAFIAYFDRLLPYMAIKSWGLGLCSKQLITSDNPVSIAEGNLESPKDIIGLSKATVFFPLTPSIVLIGESNTVRKIEICKPKILANKQVLMINATMIKNARNIVISQSSDLLQLLKSQITDYSK